jgi:endonuclease G
MLRRLVIVAALALCPTVGMSTVALAAPTGCPQFFPQGNAPDLVNPKLLPKARKICYSAFAVLHSGITRTPLWAAEHLTRKGLDAAVATERKDTFHEEPRLPPDERADLDDYARSGFDCVFRRKRPGVSVQTAHRFGDFAHPPHGAGGRAAS